MSRPRRLLWLLLWPVGVAFGFIAELEQAGTGVRNAAWLIADLLAGWTFIAAGLIAWDRRPGNRVGPLVIAIGFTWFVGTLKPVPIEIVRYLATGLQGWFEPLLGVLVLVYPSGYFGARAGRFVGAAWVVDLLGWSAARLILSRPLTWYPDPTSAAAVERFVQDRLLLDDLGAISLAVSVGLGATTLLLIVRRWLASTPSARRTLAPVLLGGLVLIITLVVAGIARLTGVAGASIDDTWYSVGLSLSRMVVAIGVLVGLTATRLARTRVADLIEQLGNTASPRRLREALVVTLGDPTIELLEYDGARSAFVDAEGSVVDMSAAASGRAVTVLEGADGPSAAIVHDDALLDDPGLVTAVGAAVRLTIDNDRLRREIEIQLEEVRASRARIVTTADEERRRVERDLHDGAQQRLVGLTLALRRAEARVGGPADGELRALLREASEELGAAIDELRELARGIHPAILTDGGLGPAIHALARRSPVETALDIQLEGRLDPALESTVYFVTAEALANAAKHADATRVHISAAAHDRRLRLEVADNGSGGADPSRGSGLRGLADRVAALGGRLEIDSVAGQGTRVVAELPIP